MSALDIAAIEARRAEVIEWLKQWPVWGKNPNDGGPLYDISIEGADVKTLGTFSAAMASSADIPAFCAEVQHLRVVRENQAAVIRKQRKELDELRYRLEGAAK